MFPQQYSQIFQYSYFKEHLRTAVSEVNWESRRDGFLFHCRSRSEVLKELFWKFWENCQENIHASKCFFNFNSKNYSTTDGFLEISWKE